MIFQFCNLFEFCRCRSNTLKKYDEPEISKISLQNQILSVLSIGTLDIVGFFSELVVPPNESSLSFDLATLEKCNAIEKGKLSAFGKILAKIPADRNIGTLLIYSAFLSCNNISTASILSENSIFNYTLGKLILIDLCN